MADTKPETRQPTIESLTAENVRLQGELDVAQGIVAEQAERLSNVEAAQTVDAAVVVTHDKKQYRVIGKAVQVKGRIVKADELGKDKEALAFLVESQSGLLVPIEKK